MIWLWITIAFFAGSTLGMLAIAIFAINRFEDLPDTFSGSNRETLLPGHH